MNLLQTPEFRLLKKIRGLKLSSNQAIALILMLDKHPGTTRTKDVATELGCTDTQASTLIINIERKRLSRQVNVGRKFEHGLTESGARIARSLIQKIESK
jgi:Mn-dependent DtxR family transcriptional regulator